MGINCCNITTTICTLFCDNGTELCLEITPWTIALTYAVHFICKASEHSLRSADINIFRIIFQQWIYVSAGYISNTALYLSFISPCVSCILKYLQCFCMPWVIHAAKRALAGRMLGYWRPVSRVAYAVAEDLLQWSEAGMQLWSQSHKTFWKKATFCLSFSPVYWGLENHQQKERERYKYTTMCTHRWLTGCQCARSWLILSSDSFHDTCLRNSEELQFPQELSRVTLIAAMRADTRHPNK